jgi:hypothetical protein
MLAEVEGLLYSHSASAQSLWLWSGVVLFAFGITVIGLGEVRKTGMKQAIEGGESHE